MRVIIAGSRNITDMEALEKAIADSEFCITEVVCGEADGVDLMGKEWALRNNLPVKSFPAPWTDMTLKPQVIRYNASGPYNALAGILRNTQMAEYADSAIVVWDGKSSGSENMIRQMQKRKKPCHIHKV